MPKPDVSVVIPSYNHADFVGIAINSVLEQTAGDLEVIVVDDGSTDATPERIAAIKDPRLKFIPLKENRREHPRNLALSIAKGEYIAFQNSDDEWELDKLDKQLHFMENNNNIAACFTNVAIIDEKGRPRSGTWLDGAFEEQNRPRLEWLKRFFFKGNCLCISSAMVRTSDLLRAGHFCPSLLFLSDFDLWVRLLGIAEIHIIGEPLTKMRVMKGKNLSSPDNPSKAARVFERVKVLSRYADPPIFGDVQRIFEGEFQFDGSPASSYVGLAKLAWRTGAPAHMLFADQLFSRVLEDKALREEALDLYGAGLIEEFIKNRSEIGTLMSKKGKR